MEFSQLSDRALQIRQAFAAYEQRRTGRTWTREEIMQGFVGDVGDLMKLVMAKAGARVIEDTDRKLAHELDGELKDDQRSVMTAQTIEHYRQRITDFERRHLTKQR